MPTVRSRKRRWLSVVIVVSLVSGLAWWSVSPQPGLHLRAVLTEHTDSDNGPLYVKGFSPDGSMLVAVTDGTKPRDAIVVWDVASDKVQKVIGPEKNSSSDENKAERTRPPESVDNQGIHFLGFSPEGRMIAVANDAKGFQLWDTKTWQVRAEMKAWNVDECRFFSDGKTLLIRSGLEPQIWDLPTRRPIAILESACELTEVAETWLAPDDKTLVIVVNERDEAGYKWCANTWDTATWQERHSIRWRDAARCKNGISPDGRLVAGIDDEGSVRVWDIATGLKLRETKLPETEELDRDSLVCGWCPAGGNYLVCLPSGPLLLYNFEKGQVRTVGRLDTAQCEEPFISWSRDGRTLAFLTYEFVPRNLWMLGLPTILQQPASSLFGAPAWREYCSVRHLNMTTGRMQAGPWDNKRFRSVAVSPDGSILAVGDHRGKVNLFDVPGAHPSIQ